MKSRFLIKNTTTGDILIPILNQSSSDINRGDAIRRTDKIAKENPGHSIALFACIYTSVALRPDKLEELEAELDFIKKRIKIIREQLKGDKKQSSAVFSEFK